MVRASRDSEDFGILGGDLILVEPRQEVGELDLAVYESGGRIELQGRGSASASGNGAAAARFLGVARAVLRTLARD